MPGPDARLDARRRVVPTPPGAPRGRERVSIVVPALDEEGTVGDVVAVCERLRRAGEVDEVLVVDGGSRDGTAAEAARAGARVVAQADVLAEHGDAAGKGEAMWKGLAATTGEVLAFVDADLDGLDADFLTGLIAPLRDDPALSLVKAAYDRPLRLAGGEQPSGGGRVNELTARPLLAAFYPELAWLAQPLAGEYAARRSLLQRLPFVQGYGVEVGLLIDALAVVGADGIGQVDLGARRHQHQDLPSLGRMAAEILQVVLDRLVRDGHLAPEAVAGTDLPQPGRDADGRLVVTQRPVRVGQRPPLADVLAARRGA